MLHTESSSSDTIDAKKQRIDECDTESSSDTVVFKNERVEKSDTELCVLPSVEPSSVTVDLTDEVDKDIALTSLQVSSSSNINDLSTGVIQNEEPNSQYNAQNQNEQEQIEVTADITTGINPGIIHIVVGLNHFINSLTDAEKRDVCSFLHVFALNIQNRIKDGSGN